MWNVCFLNSFFFLSFDKPRIVQWRKMESLTTKSPSPPKQAPCQKRPKAPRPTCSHKNLHVGHMLQGHMGQAALPRFGTHYAKVQPDQGAEEVDLSRNPTGRRRPSSPTGQQLLWLQVRPVTYLYQNGYSPVGAPWRPPNSPGTATGPGGWFLFIIYEKEKKNPKNNALGITTDQSCPLFPKAEPRALLIGTTLSE